MILPVIAIFDCDVDCDLGELLPLRIGLDTELALASALEAAPDGTLCAFDGRDVAVPVENGIDGVGREVWVGVVGCG